MLLQVPAKWVPNANASWDISMLRWRNDEGMIGRKYSIARFRPEATDGFSICLDGNSEDSKDRITMKEFCGSFLDCTTLRFNINQFLD